MATRQEGQNEYERAFESRLREAQIRVERVDQTHRCVLNSRPVKTFDYLVYPQQGGCVLVELKGRIFRGRTLAGRVGLERWVFAEDVAALGVWRRRFARQRPDVQAAFVFAYRLEQIDVDPDGLGVYEYGAGRYVFLAVRRQDYQRWMTCRSERWQTVTCPAKAFQNVCFPAESLWQSETNDEYNDFNAGRDGSGRRSDSARSGAEAVGGVLREPG